MDGDTLRLGSVDAPIFVARFVMHDQPTDSSCATPAVSQRLAELEAALHERDAELARVRTLCKQLQARLDDTESRAALDAAHGSASLRDQDVLQEELCELRVSHADSREDLSDAQSKCQELEDQLIKQRRQAQNSLQEAEDGRARSEHELSRTRSELAVVRQALTVATANVDALKTGHDELLTRLAVYEDARRDEHTRRADDPGPALCDHGSAMP